MAKQKATKKTRDGLDKNPIWSIINDPQFLEKCHSEDLELIAKLRALAAMPRQDLGKIFRDALYHTTDHRVGRVMKALSDKMTHEAHASIAIAISEQCELPKD